MTILSSEEFLARFAVEFDLGEQPVSTSTRVVADLDFDSLDLLRLSVFLDVIGDAVVPEGLEELADFTLGDIYHYYRVSREQRGDVEAT